MTLNVELLRSSIPGSINNDVIVEESLSKEYDTIEKGKMSKARFDGKDQFGSIASSGTAARGQLYSVDRTLDSIGYEAVGVLQNRDNPSLKNAGAVSHPEEDVEGTPKPGLSAAISDSRKIDEYS